MGSRSFILAIGALAGASLVGAGCATPSTSELIVLNDVHSGLNPTVVTRVVQPDSLEALRAALEDAREEHLGVSIGGGHHAMGGQQFGTDTVHIDMNRLDRVLSFDRGKGIIEVEAGIQWPALIQYLNEHQEGQDEPWAIRQKQTGADRFSIGGSLSANIHGRGLHMAPLIADVESFLLLDSEGRLRKCNRHENQELFGAAIGGYGLFGVIYSVKLRLMPRTKLERRVEQTTVDKAVTMLENDADQGALYGDFQFSIDDASEGYLREGVLAVYKPVPPDTPIPSDQRRLSESDWKKLFLLSHTDKKKAVAMYTQHYLSTSGQIYWSDLHQLSTYLDGYHRDLDSVMPGSEMISELYVPRDKIGAFMEAVRTDALDHDVNLVYGTVRLILKDEESFLAWARDDFACIVFNLHVEKGEPGLEKAREDSRRLIQRAIEYGGSFYLTYHRWATREQLETCYPQFRAFLQLKKKYDPAGRFQSSWHRHYANLFAED